MRHKERHRVRRDLIDEVNFLQQFEVPRPLVQEIWLYQILQCILEFSVLSSISVAFSIAPFIPFGPGVSTRFAPKSDNKVLLSRLIVSGIVRVRLYPLEAHTNWII